MIMSMARSFSSPKLPSLYTTSPYRSPGHVTMPPHLLWVSTSTHKFRLLAGAIEPTKEGNTNIERNTSKLPIQPAPPTPNLPNVSKWLKWVVSSIIWLSFPSWKKLQSIEEVVKKVNSTLQVVEEVAEVTEKITSDAAEKLPDDGKMKKVVLVFEHASEEVLKDAKLLDAFVHKVDGLKEKFKMTDPADQGKLAEKKPE